MHAILLCGKRESPQKGKALSPGVLGRISAVSCWTVDERLGRRPAHVSCEVASFLLAVGRRAGDRALVPGDLDRDHFLPVAVRKIRCSRIVDAM
jgi:hypothetical protein